MESRSYQAMPLARNDSVTDYCSHWMGENIGSSPFQLSECRICHDEDENSNMETPCSCRGSLKYAHRKCIQRWCYEKGDAICEICREEFKPGCTERPESFHSGASPFQLRGSWEFFQTDLQTPPQFMAVVADDHHFMESGFNDCPTANSTSLMCCRAVAIIFVVLVLLRYTLPIIVSDVGEYPVTLLTLMLMTLRAIGNLLPVYIMTRAFAAIRRRQQQQDPRLHWAPVDEESDFSGLQALPSAHAHPLNH